MAYCISEFYLMHIIQFKSFSPDIGHKSVGRAPDTANIGRIGNYGFQFELIKLSLIFIETSEQIITDR